MFLQHIMSWVVKASIVVIVFLRRMLGAWELGLTPALVTKKVTPSMDLDHPTQKPVT